MRKNLIFDVGDVLLGYRWKEMLMEHGLDEERTKRVAHKMFNSPYWPMLDLAYFPIDEIIGGFRTAFPEEADDIEWFITHGEFMHVRRPKVWEKVHELKEKGYNIYLLSNYSEELFRKHTSDASFMKDIDGGIVSYMVHCIKPDYRIYRLLMEKYSLKPEECIFFDDRADNVKAANDLGIDGRQVESEDQLLDMLSKL